jgi:hypothetical protein
VPVCLSVCLCRTLVFLVRLSQFLELYRELHIYRCRQICCLCRWCETMSLNCDQQRAYCSHPRRYTTIETWRNDTNKVKLKKSERNLSQCHLDYHKSHMNWPGREPGLFGARPATNCLSHCPDRHQVSLNLQKRASTFNPLKTKLV